MNNRTIYCSSAETNTERVLLVPNRQVKNLTNTGCYGLVICCSAAASANLPVFIQTTIGEIPVLCKAGNTMYANQLNTRVRYPIMYGNQNDNYENGQIVVLSCVNPKSEVTPIGSI